MYSQNHIFDKGYDVLFPASTDVKPQHQQRAVKKITAEFKEEAVVNADANNTKYANMHEG